MKGYRRKVRARFHVEHDPLLEDLDRRVNCVEGALIAMAVVSAASAAYSIYSSKEAAEEQEKIAAANAARIKAENEEALRRLKKKQEETLAEARARAAASGVTAEGTQRTYLEEMAEAFKSETDWLRQSGASRALIVQREGELQAQMTTAAGISSAFASARSAIGAIGSYYGSGV